MADNDQNDEYRFDEFDSIENESMGELDSGLNNEFSSGQQESATEKKNIIRNAIIVVAVVIAIIIGYKILGSIFFANKTSTTPQAELTPMPQTTQPPTTVTQAPVQQIQPVQTAASSEGSQDLEKKVAAIELAQQNLRSDVNGMNDQLGGLSSSINSLNTQIANLSQVVTNLSNQVAKQSEEISILMARTQPKKVKAHVVRQVVPAVKYYLQAVIPGRAWLIGSNGSTLTVREGTNISGYGVVRLIDSLQGRIVTSSGRVIRFSQEDS